MAQRHLLAGFVGIAFGLSAMSASAEEPSGAPEAAASAAEEPRAEGPQKEPRRGIEEIIVTSERIQSTVSDTSISITAFDAERIEALGMQGPDELVNFIPSTTRDDFDIRIRGVGRNFRNLGGDAGVATYYNGVYSEDFGIASTESALYDLERIEVLRGPQGTLYGRNAVGGALNYLTKQPSYDTDAELQVQLGSDDDRQYSGFVTGALIPERVAYRLTMQKRLRDGTQDGRFGSNDVDSINDQNYALALRVDLSETLSWNIRYNDRKSDRKIGQDLLIDEGPAGARGFLDTGIFANGLRPVPAGTPGALTFVDPRDGSLRFGAPVRPGFDPASSFVPSPFFGTMQALNKGGSDSGLDREATTNGRNDETFDQNALQSTLTWDVNGAVQVEYIAGWSRQNFAFDTDMDFSNSELSNTRALVDEPVRTYSHELRLNYQIGEKFRATSGVYLFDSTRKQDFAIANDRAQGRFVNPVNYGPVLQTFAEGIISNPSARFARLGEAESFSQILGLAGGDPLGRVFQQKNEVNVRAYAAFTQGTYEIDDQLELVIGLRWARDEKRAFENRTAYFEQRLGEGGFADFIIDGIPDQGVPGLSDIFPFLAGRTPLEQVNFVAGNLVFDTMGNLVPACPLTAPTCANPLFLQGLPLRTASKTSDSDEWDDINFRVNLNWEPNENTLVYFSVTTGYRAGGYALGAPDGRVSAAGDPLRIGPPLSYDQEEILATEIGYKADFFDRRLQIFASIYNYDYENYIDSLEVFDPVRASVVDIVQNAPSARNSGFEIETTWLATETLTVGGNYSYASTEYDRDYEVVDFSNPALPTAIFGSLGEIDAAGRPMNADLFLKNVEGNDLKRIPKHKGTLWASRLWDTTLGEFNLRASVAYTGKFFTDAINSSQSEVDERYRTDLSLSWTPTSGRYVVRAFVDNLFDDVALRNIGGGGAGGNYLRTGSPLLGRFFGVNVSFRPFR